MLIDRQVVHILTSIQEKNTTLMGLILWTGFRRAEITYTRMDRKHEITVDACKENKLFS